MEPSMKAAAMRAVLDDIRICIRNGKVPESLIHSALEPADREILGDDVPDSAWVPIRSYARIYRLLARVEVGGGSPDYYRARGFATADRLIDAGIYPQISYVGRTDGSPGIGAMVSGLRMTATLWNAVYNFGHFAVRQVAGEERLELLVTDVEPMPDFAWDAVHGFIDRLVQESGVALDMQLQHRASNEVCFSLTWR